MSAPHPQITQRQALESLWDHGQPGNWCPAARLADEHDVPIKVALRKIEGLVEKGLADYGTSPAYAWRTPAGNDRLRALQHNATPVASYP